MLGAILVIKLVQGICDLHMFLSCVDESIERISIETVGQVSTMRQVGQCVRSKPSTRLVFLTYFCERRTGDPDYLCRTQ